MVMVPLLMLLGFRGSGSKVALLRGSGSKVGPGFRGSGSKVALLR